MHKNILILTPFYPPNIGGAESFTEGLVKEASQCSNITVLTYMPMGSVPSGKEQSFTYPSGSLNVLRLNGFSRPTKTWQGLNMSRAFLVFLHLFLASARLNLRREKFQIIHAQGLISGLIAVLLKKAFKVKAFVTLLALYEFDKKGWLFNTMAGGIFRNCDIIFVEGKNGQKDIKRFNVGSKVRIFQHWVDSNHYRPPQSRDSTRTRILFVGRPIKEKGRHILEGAERILSDRSKYEFIYVENVPYKYLPGYYQMAHVVAVPSLYAEGFARVVAEAASCGCAVITSDNGSLPEMVREFGYVSSIENFTENLKKVADNWKQFSERSIEYANANFRSNNAEVFIREYRV